MPKLSAGILLYRQQGRNLEVFLVHSGGPFWAKKDAGAWSVPKGEYNQSDDPLTAARREFKEETGQDAPAGEPIALGEVKYSNKALTVWALPGDLDAKVITSNTFQLEWPPKSGKMHDYPEVDKARWFDPPTATEKLVKGQQELVTRLLDKLDMPMPTASPQSRPDPPQLSLF